MQQTHPLSVWLSRNDERQASFARRTKVSESYLSQILSWQRVPSLKLAARFEEATGGKVRASEMLRVDTEAA